MKVYYTNYINCPEATEISRGMSYLRIIVINLGILCCIFSLASGILWSIATIVVTVALLKWISWLEEKKIKEAIERVNEENRRRLIFYCSKCGYTGSDFNEKNGLTCPECGNALHKTSTTRAEWIMLSNSEKAELKNEWNSFYR